MNRLAGAAALLALAAAPAAAQSLHPMVAPGVRVRVTAPEHAPPRVVGEVAEATPQTLVVRPRGADGEVAIPTAAIRRVDISMGRSRQKGARIGAVVGGLTCITAGFLMNDWEGLGLVLAGSTVCPIAGYVVGLAFPTERWQRVPAAPRAAAPGVSLGLSLRP